MLPLPPPGCQRTFEAWLGHLGRADFRGATRGPGKLARDTSNASTPAARRIERPGCQAVTLKNVRLVAPGMPGRLLNRPRGVRCGRVHGRFGGLRHTRL